MLNPNGTYVSVQSVHGSVTQKAAAKIGTAVDGGWITDGKAPMNTTRHDRVQRMWVCRTRTAYGRQRGTVVLCASCLLPTWYISGLCVHESPGETNRRYFIGTYSQNLSV